MRRPSPRPRMPDESIGDYARYLTAWNNRQDDAMIAAAAVTAIMSIVLLALVAAMRIPDIAN